MKKFNLLLPSLLSVFLFSCGGTGNTDRQDIDNINAYGQLLSFEKISKVVATKDLQSQVEGLGVCLKMATGSPFCTKNVNYINKVENSATFGFDKDISLNNFVIRANVDSINAYKISYNTPGQTSNFSGGSPANEKVSGLVLIPNFSDSSNKIKGVVLYYHPTVLSKNNVPSAYFDLQNLQNDQIPSTAYNLATIFASQGYIVVAPDYVGQGDDYNVLHPYALYPQVNALSGIYMLSAMKQFLTEYLDDSPLPSDKLHLYISSYSEGAPYALWTSRFLQSEYAGILTKNNLDLKRTIGISGAYNLSGRQLPFAYAKVDSLGNAGGNTYNVSPGLNAGDPILDFYPENLKAKIYATSVGLANFDMAASKIVLGSYAYTSFIHYNYNGNESFYNTFFKSNTRFLNMDKCLNYKTYLGGGALDIDAKYCSYKTTLEGLFSTRDYQENDIMDELISSGMGSHNDITSNYFNSGLPFSNLIENIFAGTPSNNSIGVTVNDLSEDVLAVIRKADTYNFTTSSPITLVYMNYDSTVTNLNSTDALNSIKSFGSSGLVKSVKVDNTQIYSMFSKEAQVPMYLEHSDAEFIANLVALAQIKSTEVVGNK